MENFTLRLPTQLKTQLQAQAKDNGYPFSPYLRQVLKRALESQEEKKDTSLKQIEKQLIEQTYLLRFLVHAAPNFSHDGKMKIIEAAKKRADEI